MWRSWFDYTIDRFDENTKIIVIDGPIACGKSELAAKLAEEFDMKHYPEPTGDDFYINPYGFDLRTLDPRLPENCRSFDHKAFNKDPTHRHAGRYQFILYQLRFRQYMDAMTHLLNTGQGIILERSIYSDYVFANAMVENNFMTKEARVVYQDLKDNTINFLFRPHLVVYLDTPINVIRDRVKERNRDYEKDSKILTDGFLTSLEKHYKQEYLKEISKHSEILVYDWSVKGETEIIVEDIERIDFDTYDYGETKGKDWRKGKEVEWADIRMGFTNNKTGILNLLTVPNWIADELMINGEDSHQLELVLNSVPCLQYDYGYNAEAGDTGILFKNKSYRRETQLNVL